MKYPEDCGFSMYKKDYEARDFEYIYRRNKDNLIEPISYEQTSSHKYVRRRFNQRCQSDNNTKNRAH